MMKDVFGAERVCTSWFEEEMKESVELLRKKLEKMNAMEVEEVNSQELDNFKDIYKTFYYIACLSKDMNK